jgi:hypothetical protein
MLKEGSTMSENIQVVKSFLEIQEIFKREGWKYVDYGADEGWSHPKPGVKGPTFFNRDMVEYCGEEAALHWNWRPEWLVPSPIMKRDGLLFRNGSRVSLKSSGCCNSDSHSGYGEICGLYENGSIFRVKQSGSSFDIHHIDCIGKVLRF